MSEMQVVVFPLFWPVAAMKILRMVGPRNGGCRTVRRGPADVGTSKAVSLEVVREDTAEPDTGKGEIIPMNAVCRRGDGNAKKNQDVIFDNPPY
jgi:hypothetical protein